VTPPFHERLRFSEELALIEFRCRCGMIERRSATGHQADCQATVKDPNQSSGSGFAQLQTQRWVAWMLEDGVRIRSDHFTDRPVLPRQLGIERGFVQPQRFLKDGKRV